MSDYTTMTPRELLSAHAELVSAFNATGDDGETIAQANFIADELERRDAELAALAPLAEAAVAHWQARDADDLAALNATSNAVWDAVKAYARAQAQDGGK
jgi:hypothetical protein